jgi:hypothetical protein
MVRYRGCAKARAILIRAMHESSRRDENNSDYVTWWFADAETAAAFAADFIFH